MTGAFVTTGLGGGGAFVTTGLGGEGFGAAGGKYPLSACLATATATATAAFTTAGFGATGFGATGFGAIGVAFGAAGFGAAGLGAALGAALGADGGKYSLSSPFFDTIAGGFATFGGKYSGRPGFNGDGGLMKWKYL